jgi:hypothetical protein
VYNIHLYAYVGFDIISNIRGIFLKSVTAVNCVSYSALTVVGVKR